MKLIICSPRSGSETVASQAEHCCHPASRLRSFRSARSSSGVRFLRLTCRAADGPAQPEMTRSRRTYQTILTFCFPPFGLATATSDRICADRGTGRGRSNRRLCLPRHTAWSRIQRSRQSVVRWLKKGAQPEHCAKNAYADWARPTTRKRRSISLHSASPTSPAFPTRQHGARRNVPGPRGLDQFREPEWATKAKLPSCGRACAMAARASPS
jgi:hypothetical protein